MRERRHVKRIRILPIIRTVRTRWRLKMIFRGVSIVMGAGFVAFLLSAYGLEAARFSPAAVTTLRIVSWSVVGAVTLFFLLRPILRHISDEQVALYLEEHEPSLESAIMGAVEVEKGGSEAFHAPSPQLLDRLVERAVQKARRVDYGRAIDRPGLYAGAGALAFLFLLELLFLVFAPPHLRFGVRALVLPTTGAEEVSPYSISVLPGDVTVARGADQLVTAELRGFDSDEVFLFSRTHEEQPFQRLSMLPADSGAFDLLLLNLVENTRYFVEANGVRSAVYTIEVADLPYVEEMTHTYHFPSYTGLNPREVEDGGDIVALAGTRVELSVRPTIPTPGGLLLVDDSVVMPLSPAPDGSLSGEISVLRDGVYSIEMARNDGRMVAASPDYTIDVLADLPPTVAIAEPGRDAAVSAIEEVFIEARADDDYGIRDLRLVYSVNGEPEDTVPLFDGEGAPMPEVSAGHTLFLEEWELDPGDVISYYAMARDNRSGRSSEALSDIYFLNIRPFRRDFRQGEQRPPSGSQPPQGMQGEQNNSLSDLQREVVAATFNLVRDRESLSTAEFSENAVTVALAQGRVREEVAGLLLQMNMRGVSQSDAHFQEIAALLPVAIADMEVAETLLREEEPREALPPEQRALTVLQKAEETYERTVQQGQGGGGGGGGGASAEELADLFELELDRLQNQYETVQRGERQQADEEADELMERLRELARRQQQELERQRRRTEAQQGGAGGTGGEAQRSLADETEEAARRLAQLSRRTDDPELAETARRLQEAAEAMRRSAANSGRNQGLADATSALDDLEEAQRRLERSQEDRMGEGIRDALERVDRLAENQERVREDVEGLSDDLSRRREEVRSIHEQKDRMLQETQSLERELVRLQQTVQSENREAAGELSDAVEAIREDKLKETLAYTKGVVEQRDREIALGFEDDIAEDIETLRQEVASALRAYQEGTPDREMQDALDEARDLARGAQSLGRRLQNRGARGQAGQADQQGQSGEEGPPGQQGQQGQQAGQGGERTGEEEGRRGGRQGDTAGDERTGNVQGEPTPFGSATRGSPEPFSPEEVRQFTREFAQRLAQARALQEALEDGGRTMEDLEDAIRAMEELRDPETYGDLPQVALLQAQIQESLRRLEFILRREVEGESPGRAALTGSDDVPAGFRRMVEEYFRNLARRGGGGGE